MSDIRDISLAEAGERKLSWAYANMPLLRQLEEVFVKEQPFAGKKITLSVHLEAKTANLCRLLQKGGAEMHVTGSNPLSTQDDVAAALAAGGIEVYAYHAATAEEYHDHIIKALSCGPDIIIDDGGDLIHALHTELPHLIDKVIGGCEETTTGVLRLEAMAKADVLKFPMIAVNNARCKYLFDNRYGTGQSVWDGINRTTNLVVAGKHVVVAGYGWCGKGVAMRAKGMGARVIVTEVDPVKALEAMMDGFSVMAMEEAAKLGDLFVTVTGCTNVIDRRHFDLLKDGAVLANAGHFNVEVAMEELEAYAVNTFEARNNITGYVLPNGKTVFAIAEGRLVNLAAGDGHPVEIMDMSFALQALSARYMAQNGRTLKPGVYAVPEELDSEVANRKLAACGMSVDVLTDAQKKYLSSWSV
ncbi:MAG: adenosylhomocysteinase [Oscillospiraceae bacterium]|nr:adenosylhomocysteinase [Oscillospiraceae bacterium]